jgi:protein-disulfide isomerase
MKFGVFLACAVAAALLPSTGVAAKPATKAAVKHDWSRTVIVTPEGGFRMGNPAAPVKLVEYGSLACPHCRHFEETGYKPLVQNYVRTGQVSYEFRNLLINGPDISVSLLTRCAGPARFFPMSEQVYAAQPEWQKKLEDLTEADKAAIEKMTNEQSIVRFAEITGVGQIAARFGVTPARAKQCLADPKELQRLLDMTKTAMDSGIQHTPTFVINGKVTDAATWEDLEPAIRDALPKTNRSK